MLADSLVPALSLPQLAPRRWRVVKRPAFIDVLIRSEPVRVFQLILGVFLMMVAPIIGIPTPGPLGIFRREALESQQASWIGEIQLVRPPSLAFLTVGVALSALAVGALPLRRQALADPVRQHVTLDRGDVDVDGGLLQAGDP